MEIFWYSNRLFDSISEAESHDIKILNRFPGNPILEILMKNLNCVGSINMRGCCFIKVCFIPICKCAVILRCFSVWVYLILTEPTQILRGLKPIKHVTAFSHNVSQRHDIDSSMWNFMWNLMVYITWLHLAAQKSFVRKTSKMSKKSSIFKNIPKNFSTFLHFLMCAFI